MIVRLITDIIRLPVELSYKILNGLPLIVIGYMLSKYGDSPDKIMDYLVKVLF